MGAAIPFTHGTYSYSNLSIIAGKLTFNFEFCDTLGEFVVLIDAFTATGYFGTFKSFIYSKKPFYLNYTIPPTLVEKDQLQIPVYAYNNLDGNMNTSAIAYLIATKDDEQIKTKVLESKIRILQGALSQIPLTINVTN
jgi:uncharacterized protein YfaS (alpha-2-macroglobulin family)